jgi:rubrerythrin
MREMTASNLRSAFAGESQAHMRYLIFADKAEQEGFPNVARLFKAIAYAERVHATSHFNVLKDLGQTADNLGAAIGGETYEVEEMYPAFVAVAELQEEKAAIRSNSWALEAEKIHAVLYGLAKAAVEDGNDAEEGSIFVCSVCGHTVRGDAPDRCPICNSKREKYREFS